MQYLAEVQKKSGGLLGASKVELRLIACQRSEDNWQAMAGNNSVPTDKANDFGNGSLVIAEIAGNDVKRVNAATQPVLKILQHYSRLQEKLKDKDDDIEQWKQSLTYQSQELNRRVMEVEVREEELSQASEEFARLEQQRSEVMVLREEAQRSQAEVEAARAELDREQQSLEARLQDGQAGGLLDESQVRALEAQIAQVAASSQAAEGLQAQVVALSEKLESQQPVLDQFWQQAEAAGEGSGGGLGQWDAWSDSLAELEQMKGELAGLQRELVAKKQATDSLQRQLKANSLLSKQLTLLAGGLDPELAAQMNMAELEAMSLEELEAKVQERQKDYDRIFNFVNDQEEELRLQQQAMEELKVKISEASEFDRLTLETELADEQESYNILDDSMFDQRRTLSERKALLNEYQELLAKRQGQAQEGAAPSVDLGPVLTQLETDTKQQTQQLEEFKAEVQTLEAKIQELEGQVAAKAEAQEQLKQQAAASGGGDSSEAYRAVLNPVQDMVNGLREQLQSLNSECENLQASRNHQTQLINDMRSMLAEMSGGVQLSAAA